MNLTDRINEVFAPAVELLGKIVFLDLAKVFGLELPYQVPLVVVWLIFGGIYFTIRMRFINIRGFKHAIELVLGKYDKPGEPGEVSHFRALATALSATVGLGNIAGVAIAISVGGPGATFWMIVAGILGMSLKFSECTLGLKYRKISDKGIVSGGPMYYLEEGLRKRKMKYFGIFLAVLYAILIILASFGGGNMLQSNQAFAQLAAAIPFFKGKGIWIGIILAFLVGLVIIGGLKSIARVTARIVPFMAIIYILAALVIISINYRDIDNVFILIIREAFTLHSVQGGIIGVMIMGFRRGAFSNEAGIGSASIAHSAARTNTPVREGLVALLEPFIDTVVICTMTALVIVFSGVYQTSTQVEGAPLTSEAFTTAFSWFPYLLVLSIFLFAFSTMISWSYYGLNGFLYLSGKLFNSNRVPALVYRLLFLFFVILGSATQLKDVIEFSDMMILGLAFPNILGLLIMAKEIKTDLDVYLLKRKS
ncbi:MAG: alanine:cation symporter family protein [Bacteroidales bacterium]|nr:alanine:cation symporter family protein [Bacteroidales bacterium]